MVSLGESLVGAPDVVVLLRGRPDVLLERIRACGRRGEEGYDLAELEHLTQAYGVGGEIGPLARDRGRRGRPRSHTPAEIDLLAEAVRRALSSAP